MAENITIAGTIVTADVDGGAPQYTLVGAVDDGLFNLDINTGELSFLVAPDYDVPGDNDGDNVYDVTVQVDDGLGGVVTQAIAVTVTPEHLLTTTGAGFAQAGGLYTLNLNYAGPATITSWTINWGDGAIETFAGNPASVTHTYANPGFLQHPRVSVRRHEHLSAERPSRGEQPGRQGGAIQRQRQSDV
jgi:hypothetical protein